MCGILALLFLIVPALEIYVIIEVGGLLGTWMTLAVIAVTAIAGAALAKSQGVAVLRRLSVSVAEGRGTGTAIVEGVLILAAGVTLLAPGFITDALGISLLLPPIRRRIAKRLANHWKLAAVSTMSAGMAGGFDPMAQGQGEDEVGADSDSDDIEPPPPGVIDV